MISTDLEVIWQIPVKTVLRDRSAEDPIVRNESPVNSISNRRGLEALTREPLE
jgi:hypothetical protein